MRKNMSVPCGISFLISSALIMLMFSGMHILSSWITSSKLHIIFGGFLGSIIFMLLVTATGNIESFIFGRNFQTKLFPEVAFCLVTTLIMTSTIHRICATSCLIFSLVALHYMNQISQRVHGQPSQAPVVQQVHHEGGRRKKKSIFS